MIGRTETGRAILSLVLLLLFPAMAASGASDQAFPRNSSDLELCKVVALGTADRGSLYFDESSRRLASNETARRRVDCDDFAVQIEADEAALRAVDEAHRSFHSNPMPRPPPPSPDTPVVTCQQARDGQTRCIARRADGSAPVHYEFQCATDPAEPLSCRSVHPIAHAEPDARPLTTGNGHPPGTRAATPAETPARHQAKRVFPYAAIVAAAKWKTPSVPVCWENPDKSNEAGRRWTRAAVAATWEKESALRFTGWGACDRRHAGIRILVKDTGPHVVALGRRLARRRNRMVLNFTYLDWSPGCRRTIESCTRVIAVHEFGHAIGFAHEQNRHDAPGECRERRQGADPDTLLTPYDPASVMNYCNFKWNNDGVLSADDIAAVRVLYGQPPRR